MKVRFAIVLCTLLCAAGIAAQGTKGGKMITISCNGEAHTATLADNKSCEAFYKMLQAGDITLDMHDYGGFEKSGELPGGKHIVRTDKHFDTVPGDFILYQGHIIAIYYGENSYSFTRLGHIDGAEGEMMRKWLKAGEGNVSVTFSAKIP